MGASVVGADERATLVRSRRDVTADDNTRCIAAKLFASIHVGLERTLIGRKCDVLMLTTVADRGLQRGLRWPVDDSDTVDGHGEPPLGQTRADRRREILRRRSCLPEFNLSNGTMGLGATVRFKLQGNRRVCLP